MKPGSVVVDLAAATGGNCAYTEAGKVVTTENQVKVIGYTDFPSRLPTQSSQLYGTNLVNLLKLLCKEKDGKINIDFDDVVLRGVTVVRDGEEIPPAQIQVSAQPKQEAKAAQSAVKKEEEKPAESSHQIRCDGGCRCIIPLACICGASGIPFSLHRIRIGLCSRLLRGLER